MPLPENIKQPLLSEDMKKRKKNMFFMHWRELWLRSRVFYEKRPGPPSSPVRVRGAVSGLQRAKTSV